MKHLVDRRPPRLSSVRRVVQASCAFAVAAGLSVGSGPGCSEYRLHGDTPPDLDPPDTASCDVCSLAPVAAGTATVDPTCYHSDIEVADPFDIEVKSEVVLDAGWTNGAWGWWTPLLADMDADGLPELVVKACDLYLTPLRCRVSVLGSDGEPLWSLDAGAASGPLALADIDGRGGAEVLLGLCPGGEHTCMDPRLAAVDVTGAVVWTYPGNWSDMHQAAVADLEGDGIPELLSSNHTFNARTGSLLVDLDQPSPQGWSFAVADVDGDGISEFATGGTLFSADAETLWTVPLPALGGISIALQADTDPEPEFLFVIEGFTLVDTDGTVLVQVDEPSLDFQSAVVADLDGDGASELAFGTVDRSVVAYRLDGTRMWENADVGYVITMAGWDFDGDGVSELIAEVADSGVGDGAVTILAGPDGAVRYSRPNVSSAEDTPVVADIDGDGHAELIVSGGAPRDGAIPAFTIYHQAHDTWPAAGPAWPIPDFHLTDIGPAGQIPLGEASPPPWSNNVYHARPAVDGQGVDLTPVVAEVCADACSDGGTVQLDVVINNTGTRPAADVVVRVYAGDTVVAEAVVPRIDAGATSEGVIFTIPALSYDLGPVRVVADPENTLPECDESNDDEWVADPR